MTQDSTAPATAAARGDAGTIVSIETAAVSLRANPRLAVRGARGSHDSSDFLLVRVATSRGVIGYGEVSATLRWSGEDATSANDAIKRVLAPAIIGQPLHPVTALALRMDLALAGNPFTKAGLECALWDALGRTWDLRCVDLLGGPHRTEVPTKMSLSGDGDRLADVIEAIHSLGFRSHKVKVGLTPASDIARFRLARELCGDDAFLGADSNGGWSRIDAQRAIAGLAEMDPAFIEQPTQPRDLEGMAACRTFGIPILADEAVFSLDDVAAIVDQRAADALNVYVGKASGMERAVRQMRTAAVFGIPSILGSNGEMGLGAAAQIHVACAVEQLAPFPSDIIGHHYYDEDILESPLDIDGTVARLPSGPGLGVEPRADIRARFA
jgi:L-alanine-DL-glutamate epimerase-like enolase superfamily enzyme